MPAFCSNCGFPLGSNSQFCPQCGKRAGVSSAPPVPATTPAEPPATARTSSGSAAKVLLIIVGCFVLAGILGIASLFYAGHKLKQAVVKQAKDYGVELPADSSSRHSVTKTRHVKPCDVLAKSEMATLLGQPVERTEVQPEACLYYGPAGLSARLAQQGFSNTIRKAGAPGDKTAPADTATAVTQLLGGAARTPGSQGEAPLITVMIVEDGRAQMTALSAANAMFSKMPGAGAEIPGLGDRAIRLANLGLNVLKGDTVIRILPGPVPDPNDKCIAVARAILPKL